MNIAAIAMIALFAQQDTVATMNDPRVGLAPGVRNTAGIAAHNLRLVSYTPKPAEFDSARGLAYINSDLAFRGDLIYQGNFSGFSVWDVSNPRQPVNLSTVVCATDQGDPSIYGNLLFISAESPRARADCGMQGVQAGKDRMRGVRIFDVSNPRSPKLIKNVQTCRGSHTHTIVPDPDDKNTIYIYVGGSSSVRDPSEMPECSGGSVAENPNTAQYRVDIIRVPAHLRAFAALPRSRRRGGQRYRHAQPRTARLPRSDVVSRVQPGGRFLRQLRHFARRS
jgi:hypothetical protein